MMKIKKKYLSSILAVLVLLWGGGSLGRGTVFGMENEVQTNGEITFYEEKSSDSATSSSSTKNSSNSPQPTSGSADGTVKPLGKFPSTGELVKKSLTISGVLVVGFAVVFYWLNRKKKEEENE